MTDQITRSSGSVFQDLGFEREEAANLKIRANLMMSLRKVLREKDLRQREIAELLEVTQPRVSDLINGKIDRFSIDMLVNMLSLLNVRTKLVLLSADTGPDQGTPVRTASI